MNPVHQYPNHTSNTKPGIFPPPETGLQTIQLNYIKHSTHTKTPPTVSRPDKAVTGFKDNALLISSNDLHILGRATLWPTHSKCKSHRALACLSSKRGCNGGGVRQRSHGRGMGRTFKEDKEGKIAFLLKATRCILTQF